MVTRDLAFPAEGASTASRKRRNRSPRFDFDASAAVRRQVGPGQPVPAQVAEILEDIEQFAAHTGRSPPSDAVDHVVEATPDAVDRPAADPMESPDSVGDNFLDGVRDGDMTEEEAYEVYKSLLLIPVADRPLPPGVYKTVVKKLECLSQAYIDNPTAFNLLAILAFQSVGLAPGLTKYKTSAIVRRVKAYPAVPMPQARGGGVRGGGTPRSDTGVARAASWVKKGLLRRAYQSLTAKAGLLNGTASNLIALQGLHPQGKRDPFPSDVRCRGPAIGKHNVRDAVEKLRWDSSGGPSGFTPAFCKAMTSKNGCVAFVDFLTLLTKQIAEGTAPCRSMLCATRLVPMMKPGGGVRPIAVGETFYRVAGKAILSVSRVENDLKSEQFGFGLPGGVEPMIVAVQRQLDKVGGDGLVVSLDLTNAFNSIDRAHLAGALRAHNPQLLRFARWAYGNATDCLLTTDDGQCARVVSSQGVRQGDPLGPYLFSIAFRSTVEALQEAAVKRGGKVWAYLDDVVGVLPGDGTAHEMTFLDECESIVHSSAAGVRLNRSKCAAVSGNEVHDRGLPLLGTMIGSESVRRSFLRTKITDMDNGIKACAGLPLQHRLLLLTKCSSARISHLLRTLEPAGLDELWHQATDKVLDEVAAIAGVGALDAQAKTLATLPVRLGGLGLTYYADVAYAARQSFHALARHVLDGDDAPAETQRSWTKDTNDLRSEVLLAKMDVRHRLTVVDNSSRVGSAWVSMLPLFPSLRLSDRQVTSAVRCRLLVSGPARPCPACTLPLDFLHQECCQAGRQGSAQVRHDNACATFVRAARACLQRVTVEPATIATNPSQIRGDFRVQGPKATNGMSCTYDVSFISVSGVSAVRVASSCRLRPGESWRCLAERQITSIIKSREAAKDAKFKDKFTDLFVPLVLTCGGTASERCQSFIKNVKNDEVKTVYELAMVCLGARSRQVH